MLEEALPLVEEESWVQEWDPRLEEEEGEAEVGAEDLQWEKKCHESEL